LNTVTASFNTVMEQTTETSSQRKKKFQTVMDNVSIRAKLVCKKQERALCWLL